MNQTYEIRAVCGRCGKILRIKITKEALSEDRSEILLKFKKVHEWTRAGTWNGFCDGCHEAKEGLQRAHDGEMHNFIHLVKEDKEKIRCQ